MAPPETQWIRIIFESTCRTTHRLRVARVSYQIFLFLPIPRYSILVNARIDTQSIHYSLIGVRKISGKRVSI